MKHYHALAGLHSYMPMVNEVCESVADAVDVLAQVHELRKDRRRMLKRDQYLELNLHRDGNEYCEIVECEEEDCVSDE